MRMVREGNLDYRSILSRVTHMSYGVHASNGSPMDQAMVSATTFVSLSTRAAIEGGLSPESAYALGDAYIQSIMEAKNVAEMGNIANSAYGDFIRRVNAVSRSPELSSQIRACCDYIEMNLEQPLTLSDLAERAGYTEYYFSRRFRKETGIGIQEYIRNARIRRAKVLLDATDDSIAEIGERLQFCSGSHFSRVFHQVTGVTPRQWRLSERV